MSTKQKEESLTCDFCGIIFPSKSGYHKHKSWHKKKEWSISVSKKELSFFSTLNKNGRKWHFSVPSPHNLKVIEFCNEEKVNVTISKNGKSISFIAKASKFGSKNTGDKRVFIVPKVLHPNLSELCSEDPVKLTLEKLSNSSFI